MHDWTDQEPNRNLTWIDPPEPPSPARKRPAHGRFVIGAEEGIAPRINLTREGQ